MTPPPDIDALVAAVFDGLESVSPKRRAQTIALRLAALAIRSRASGFEHLTQAQAAEMLGVSQSAVSRAGDRAEEALAVYTRGHRNDDDFLSHI